MCKIKLNILIFILCFITLLYYFNTSVVENFSDNTLTYSSDGDLGQTFNDILKIYNFKKVDKNGTWFFPSDYNPCESQANKLIASNPAKYIYVMDGCDIIGSKIDLWKVLRSYYGLPLAELYMPRTYLYADAEDMKNLKNKIMNSHKNKKRMYILKNYNQRQEGIKIVTSWDEINSDINKKEFYLIQEYLYDPLLISKRKVNIRIYYLVICRNNAIEGYIYYNGFMYYTPQYYDPESIDFDKNITTGYIDRQVYVDNPLTMEDLRKYLGTQKASLLDHNIRKAMKNVTMALLGNVCKNNKNNKIKFQVYGVDIAPLSDLSVKLMEINKGPDLNAKDERDGYVKKNMQIDIFKVVEPSIDSQGCHGFIRVY